MPDPPPLHWQPPCPPNLCHHLTEIQLLGFLFHHIFRPQVCKTQDWYSKPGAAALLSPRPPFSPAPLPAYPPPHELTLVGYEAMGSQELQGVDLKKHPVEQQVVCRRPPAGIQEEAAQDEFLGCGGRWLRTEKPLFPARQAAQPYTGTV